MGSQKPPAASATPSCASTRLDHRNGFPNPPRLPTIAPGCQCRAGDAALRKNQGPARIASPVELAVTSAFYSPADGLVSPRLPLLLGKKELCPGERYAQDLEVDGVPLWRLKVLDIEQTGSGFAIIGGR